MHGSSSCCQCSEGCSREQTAIQREVELAKYGFSDEMRGLVASAEKDGVHKTKGDLCRFQLATNSVEKGSWFMSNSECVIEELSKRCYNKGGQAKNYMKNFVAAVLKGLKREFDSVKAIGSMEVSVTCEEPNVSELDELQNVFDSISGVRLDPELLSASRKVEIDFMNRLEVYRKPRNWAKDKGIHVIPTKWADVNKGDDKRLEYQSRLCGKELKRCDPTMPGTFASMGPFECVMFLLSKELMWKLGASGAATRKILFLDASRVHCQAEATSEMTIELPPEEQVKGEDLIGELLKSLYGTRKAARNWEKKWQRVIIDSGFVIGTWSPAIVC